MAGESGSFWRLERVNRRRTAELVVKLILAFAVFGLGLDFVFHNLRFSDGRLSGIPWITETAMLLAVVQALRANFGGADWVLDALDADPICSAEPKNQAVIDVVREMALAARIPEPRVEVIDDPSPNAFAVGRDPEHSVICITQGLLDEMDREELQGVIGHEMAHIRDYDTQLTTMVTAMFGGFGVLRFVFGVPKIWKKDSVASSGILSRIISIVLSREREYLADASAVEFTRNPTALIRALEHIAKTESPLRCATPGTAQLFIVDPFERAGGVTSYKQYINEITRIRLQPGKTEEQRDEEARKFAVNEYPRNTIAEKLSSHPPLGERIARLQALVGALPGAAAASHYPGHDLGIGVCQVPDGLTEDQLRANFSASAAFVASTLFAPTADSNGEDGWERMLLQEKLGETLIHSESTSRDPLEQKLHEANLAPIADPARTEGIGRLDSTAEEAQQVEALAKVLAPAAASMRPRMAATHPVAGKQRTGSAGAYLFWIVIALSAGAIVASFAIK